MMIRRALQSQLRAALARSPAVVLLGPRQVGKTTLALETAEGSEALYLDLESERDRTRLSDPERFLPPLQDRLVILDEVHRAPGLFPILRGLIDQARRQGRRHGLYLLLGSANLDLLRQSGESLAGRVAYLELAPLALTEVGTAEQDRLWLRGGFPDAYLAGSDAQSAAWREDFVRTYLERDIPQFAPRVSATTLRRFWTMLAHEQGGLFNASRLGRSLGVDARTIGSYVDLLCDLLLLRRLLPWHGNVGKRLVKSPKLYLRDSGIVHSLLSIENLPALLGHPVLGASWESFVIENLLRVAPASVQPHFYRTAAGAEIDLLLSWPDGRTWAIEITHSLSPKARRGFHQACADLQPERRLLLYPGTDQFPLPDQIEVMSVGEGMEALKGQETYSALTPKACKNGVGISKNAAKMESPVLVRSTHEPG